MSIHFFSRQRRAKLMSYLAIFSLVLSNFSMTVTVPQAVAVSAGSGSIWTTRNDCGSSEQDANHYAVGETVYINGSGFDEDNYDWDITGKPGGASSDPNIEVASGNYSVNSSGEFCFEAYTVLEGDDGEYTVSFGNKKDNYRVEDEEDPAPYCGDGEVNQESEDCDDGESGSESCTAQCTFPEEEGECELVVTKTDDGYDPVNPGDEMTYHLTITNVGDAACESDNPVYLKDFYDNNTSYVSSSVAHDGINDDYIKWDVGTLEPDETFEVDLTMLVDEQTSCDATLSNYATYHMDGQYGPQVSEETTVTCEEVLPSCEEGGIEIPVDLYVMGENCVTGGPWYQITDSEDVNLSEAANYSVYAEVHRSGLDEIEYGQDNEEFTLRVNGSSEGPVVVDNNEAQTVLIQYAGDFDFTNGTNTIYMDTSWYCDSSDTNVRNSVEVKKVCLYKNEVEEPEEYCGDGEVNQESEQCDDGNNVDGDGCSATCNVEETTFTIKAAKIVCEDEEDLPNWGAGNLVSEIKADTAANWVAQSEGKCEFATDWEFQWGRGVSDPGNEFVGHAENGWEDFDTATGDGTMASLELSADVLTTGSQTIKVREVLPEGYLPFSYWNEEGNAPGDDVSAEFYCYNDVLNYDNYDYVNYPQAGQTYYCVAFNVLDEPDVPAPWCSILLGVNESATQDNVYHLVVDMNDPEDGVVDLTDWTMTAQMYAEGDNDACYNEFEFSCDDYLNIDWCSGLVQGVTDTYGLTDQEEGFSGIFDLNDDGVINLSDLGMVAQLDAAGDQENCYAHYIPELPVMNCESSSICGVKFNDEDQDSEQGKDELNLPGWTINLYEKLSCEEGDQWADEVVEFNQGANVAPERSNPSKALGVAENNDTLNFVSLGQGGELVLKFDNLIENGAGDDIKVYETTYNSASCASYPEYIHVYASQDGVNWTDLGAPKCQENDPTFDLGTLPWAQYLKLVDETTETPDGFDVDGVEALNCLNRSEEVVDSAVTTENGYCFEDLEPNHYMVCEEMQEDWTNSTPICQQVELGENEDVTVDFGNYYSVQPPEEYNAPWCSDLLGLLKAYYDPSSVAYGVYNDVIDINNDKVVNLSDVSLVSQLYAAADDAECYKNYEDPEDEFHFSCVDYKTIGWCGGLAQGIEDYYGTALGDDNYQAMFDLNKDDVINLTDLGMVSTLLGENDQVACYNYLVPPLPEMNCGGGGETYCELTLTKSDLDIEGIYPGQELTYLITLENTGTASCYSETPEYADHQYGVLLRDTFDVNTSYVTSTYAPDTATSTYLEWDFGVLDPGDSVEMELTMQVEEELQCEFNLVNSVSAYSMQTGWTEDVSAETLVLCPINGNTPPVITLINEASITLDKGDTYQEFGATADDLEDGDITSDIVITGSVDTNTVGTYYIYYNVTDSGGLSAVEVVRSITVKNPGGGGGGGGVTITIFNIQEDPELNQATISWETNRNSLTWIQWGLTSSYTDEYKNDSYNKNHSVLLEDLEECTTYHYKLRARDSSGNTAQTADLTFDTLCPGPEPEVLGEKVCDYDCGDITYDLYIINHADGSRRFMNTVFTKIEDLENGKKLVQFEDKGLDFDYNDVVVEIDESNCVDPTFKLSSISAAWDHEVHVKIFYKGEFQKDVQLWPNDRSSVGMTVALSDFYEDDMCVADLEPEVLGEKICGLRPSGSAGPDSDVVGSLYFPNNTLIREECDTTVYLIKDMFKHRIDSPSVLRAYFRGQRIYNVLEEVVDYYPEGDPIVMGQVGEVLEGSVAGVKTYSDGSLLRSEVSGKIYVIRNGFKLYINSLDELQNYAGQKIYDVSEEVLNQYETIYE